jgi:hypothetical protein
MTNNTLLLWLVLLCLLLSQWTNGQNALSIRNEDTPKPDVQRSRPQLTIGEVKRFTRYFLYFPPREFEPLDGTCPIAMIGNTSAILLDEMITRCPNRKFFPRQLTPKQVSWKKSKTSEGGDNKTSTSSGSGGGDDESRGDEVISEFLSFSLLLANHPFSSDLYHAVAQIAPMFPRVTFVVGFALDFGDLCAQYNVRSFPKMLFFHKGLLKGKHSRAHEAGALVAELSKWTKLLPQSHPVKRRASSKDVPSSVQFNYTWNSMLAWVESKAGPSVEPIAVSSKFLVQHDALIFILSGLYVVFRIFHVALVRKS